MSGRAIHTVGVGGFMQHTGHGFGDLLRVTPDVADLAYRCTAGDLVLECHMHTCMCRLQLCNDVGRTLFLST